MTFSGVLIEVQITNLKRSKCSFALFHLSRHTRCLCSCLSDHSREPKQHTAQVHERSAVLIKLRRYIYTKLKGCERWPVWRLNRTLFLSHTESKEFQAEEFLPVAGLFLKAEITTTNHLGQSRRLQSNCWNVQDMLSMKVKQSCYLFLPIFEFLSALPFRSSSSTIFALGRKHS